MSYTRMGTIAATAIVSLEPDRSGNFVCDGTADDVEVLAALDYVKALGGGKVYINNGNYSFSTKITLDGTYDNISVFGAGKNTIITATHDDETFYLQATVDDNLINVVFADMKLVGSGSGSWTAFGFRTEYTCYSVFCRLDISNEAYWAMDIHSHSQHNIITQCRIHDNLKSGLTFGAVANYNIVVGCQVDRNANDGIFTNANEITVVACEIDLNENGVVLSESDAVVTGCTFHYNSISGVKTDDGCFVATITGNFLARQGYTENTPPGGYGIWVSGSHDITITGNQINHNYSGGTRTGHGIFLDGCQRITVCGNSIYECAVLGDGADGIHLDNADYCLIGTNHIYDNNAYGIMIDNGSVQNQIVNNFTQANGTACCRINNVNCTNNLITYNCFDEGDIDDVGGAHNCVAFLNYDPSANAFITEINSPLLRFVTGQYTGDDTVSQAITGVGFAPKMVMIWRHYAVDTTNAKGFYTKTDTFETEFAFFVADTCYCEDNHLISLDADGFTVDDDGASKDPNANTIVYDYACWR